MTDIGNILKSAHTVLVVDWPSRDVPDTLARAGFTVIVRGGPGPNDYSAYDWHDGQVVRRPMDAAPERVDLVYAHRPATELPRIVAMAQSLGATTIWVQSGLARFETKDPYGCWVPDNQSRSAREIVESAGLTYVEKPYIADAVRQQNASA